MMRAAGRPLFVANKVGQTKRVAVYAGLCFIIFVVTIRGHEQDPSPPIALIFYE